jgi:hypothetical protein
MYDKRPVLAETSAATGCLIVYLHWIDQSDVISPLAKVSGVGSGTTAHVNNASAWRQVAIEDVPGSKPNEVAFTWYPQSGVFVRHFVATDDPIIQSHGPQPYAW